MGKSKRSTKSKFRYCPHCNCKGLYQISQQLYRCRYCGTYIVSPPETADTTENDKQAE